MECLGPKSAFLVRNAGTATLLATGELLFLHMKSTQKIKYEIKTQNVKVLYCGNFTKRTVKCKMYFACRL